MRFPAGTGHHAFLAKLVARDPSLGRVHLFTTNYDTLIEQGEKFDAVILDPPKFARGRGGANQALMAYHRINRAAVELLERGGILLSCSCTGGVSREDFLLMLSGVAQKSRRDIRVLEQRGAAPDHPVCATCLETEYLKCMICEIR